MTDSEPEILDGGEIVETPKRRGRELFFKYRRVIFITAVVFLGLLVFLPIILAYLTRPRGNLQPSLPAAPTLGGVSPAPKPIVNPELVKNDDEIKKLENGLTDLNLLEPQLNFPSLDWAIVTPQN